MKKYKDFKKWKVSLCSIILCTLSFACQDSENSEPVKETGFLRLGLGLNIENQSARTTAVETDEFNVIVYDAADNVIMSFDDYIDVPTEIELPEGDYYVFVSSDNLGNADFDSPYYTGVSDVFTIVKGDVVDVTVSAELANVKVSVAYSATVQNDFTDWSTTVTTISGALVFLKNETRSGFFIAGEDLTVQADLTFTKADLSIEVRTISGTITNTQAKDHYLITVDYTLEDGVIFPFLIAVDESTVDIPIDLSPAPTVQERLDNGETPSEIYESDNSLLSSLYGATYQGGLIYYLNTTEGIGLVAAPIDQSAGIQWWSQNPVINIGNTSSEIGTGQINTPNIIDKLGTTVYAAHLCANLDLNGYSDWYLPSRDELIVIYDNLHANGLGGFSDAMYWSSSEGNSTNTYSYHFDYDDEFLSNKIESYRVRAVRAFILPPPVIPPPPPIQQRLNDGETPFEIYNSDNSLLNELYGKSYDGGLIFYLNTSDGTGLLAATEDQSAGAEWGCIPDLIAGADGIAIGTGYQNTIDIEAGCSTAGTAADLCANLILNGKSDWFLPSRNELDAMYDNLIVIAGLDFGYNRYWSSTEANSVNSCNKDMRYGNLLCNAKSLSYYVRAVRAF